MNARSRSADEQKAAAKALDQRRKILDYSQELFFKYGYARVTIDEIAAELHMSKNTFYKHFGTKEALLSEVIQNYYNKIQQGVDDILSDKNDEYVAKLKKTMYFICDKLESLDVKAKQDIKNNAPLMWEKLQELQHKSVHIVFEELLRKGIEKKVVRKDLDLKLMSKIVIITIEQILSGDALRKLSVSLQDAFQNLINIFLEGILVGKPVKVQNNS